MKRTLGWVTHFPWDSGQVHFTDFWPNSCTNYGMKRCYLWPAYEYLVVMGNKSLCVTHSRTWVTWHQEKYNSCLPTGCCQNTALWSTYASVITLAKPLSRDLVPSHAVRVCLLGNWTAQLCALLCYSFPPVFTSLLVLERSLTLVSSS